MQGELVPCALQSLGDATQIVDLLESDSCQQNTYKYGPLDLRLFDVVDLLCGDDEVAVLCPVVHVDLLDLVRKQQLL